MSKIIVSLGIGVLAGFSLSFLLLKSDENAPDYLAASNAVESVECVCDLQRVREFDRALQDERNANILLRAEVDRLLSELDESEARRSSAQLAEGGDWLQSAWADLTDNDEPADRRQMLIDAGVPPARTDWILQRESELHMAALEENYQDAAAGPLDYVDSRVAGRQALREEIGDYEYEQYLAGTGQSTSVSITQVMTDSPAQNAGFQVGDEIVDYDGMRVFNIIELANKAQDGAPGEAVIVNIMRNGGPMQLVLPRGPLGVSGGKPMRPWN